MLGQQERLQGEELLQGAGRMRHSEARLQGDERLQGSGRMQQRRQWLRGQELLQGPGRMRSPDEEEVSVGRLSLRGVGQHVHPAEVLFIGVEMTPEQKP